MDNMKIQCQVYHNGALGGNDVHKLTKNENISNISTDFKPLLIDYQMIWKKNCSLSPSEE